MSRSSLGLAIAVVGFSLACGGGDEPAEWQNLATEQIVTSATGASDVQIGADGSVKVAGLDGASYSAGAGVKLPAAWPADVPSWSEAPAYAMEMSGSVTGKQDVTATWTITDTFQQVQDKYTALEGKGWTRTFAMNDATMFSGMWTSADGKLTTTVMAAPDGMGAGKNTVTVVVSNQP